MLTLFKMLSTSTNCTKHIICAKRIGLDCVSTVGTISRLFTMIGFVGYVCTMTLAQRLPCTAVELKRTLPFSLSQLSTYMTFDLDIFDLLPGVFYLRRLGETKSSTGSTWSVHNTFGVPSSCNL